MKTPITIILLSCYLLQGCSSGDSKSEEDFAPGTFAVSGSISGLAGEIVIDINGTEETLDTNGDFTAVTRVNENERYNISISDDNGLTCTIDNGSGQVTSDVTDIHIQCDGSDFSAYRLNNLGFSVEEPSIVTFAFHLIDRYTETAVTGITKTNVTDYLHVYENQQPISKSESFLELDQLVNFNTEYSTVYAIDISLSIKEQLPNIIAAIKSSIVESETGQSKLQPNQFISIVTFDDTVTTVISQSQDPKAIVTALDSIETGANSTNLYGAIEAGANLWDNEISLNKTSYGSLILFTDGNHTSDDGNKSKSNALDAIDQKDAYFITVGDETDVNILKEFTLAKNIYSLADFNDVETTLQETFARVKTYEDGLYLLSYAGPKRSGTHKLTVKAVDDYDCATAVTEQEQNEINSSGQVNNCTDQAEYNFNANDFTSVEPELVLIGTPPAETYLPSLELTAKLKWTNEQNLSYDWRVEKCVGEVSYVISADKMSATVTRESSTMAVAKVIVEVSGDQMYQTGAGLFLVPVGETITKDNINYFRSACDL